MGRKILVVCSILVLLCNVVGAAKVNKSEADMKKSQTLLCDEGELIWYVPIKS